MCKKLVLWKIKYSSKAYKDHAGYIVLDTIPVTIVETKKVLGEYSGENGSGNGYKAVSDKNELFVQNWSYYPDASTTPTFYWFPAYYLDKWKAEGYPTYVDALQASNFQIAPYVNVDGTKAVPPETKYCDEHELYYATDDTCIYCDFK